jgi:uncharacterized protein YdbL (DUF1318 family)
MYPMLRWITAGLTAFCLALAACVTINVYFPAAAAEKAADRIIGDIWGPEKGPKPSGNEQGSLGYESGNLLFAALRGTLDFVIPAAHAEADLDVSSPAIRTLTASMKARAADLDPYFTSGAIGLTSDGQVEIRDANSVALADRNKLKQLVADDNRDRKALYAEIATANGHPDWEADIRSTFAERWIANARTGWYYKSKAGAWTQK